MNLKEGTRRLAVLLGVAGAIVGGFASYMELQSVKSQRARHAKFEQLAASEVVKEERKCRLLGYAGGCSQIELPPDATLVKPQRGKYTDEDIALGPGGPVTVLGPDEKTYHFPEGTDKAAAIRYFKRKGIGSDPFAAIAEPSSNVPLKFRSEYLTPLASEVNV